MTVKTKVVQTKVVQTPHGPKTVASVVFTGTVKGVKQFATVCHNSLGQPVTGGFSFSAGSSMAKQHGV